MPHPKLPVAVHVLLLRGDEVLLVRRCNTGFEDGRLSVVAGHVEPGQSVTKAALRAASGEVGVALSRDGLWVVGVMHRRSQEERVDFFLPYRLGSDGGKPRNRGPGKESDFL